LIIIAAFESPAVIAGFDDIAVVGQAIEQRGRHLGVAEYGRLTYAVAAGANHSGKMVTVLFTRARVCNDGVSTDDLAIRKSYDARF
jgi:hypothetical protein